MVAFFVDPLPHLVLVHLERARDMAHDVRDQHPIMLVREVSGMKVRDGLSIVFEADDSGFSILISFRMMSGLRLYPVMPFRAPSAR